MPQNPLGAFVSRVFGGSTFGASQLAPDASLEVSGSLPDEYLQAFAGAAFSGANQTGVTTSAALATTYVGCCLSNPASSGVNLLLKRVTAAFSVAPATITTIGLLAGYAAGGITVHTTALTPSSDLLGSGKTSAANLDAACTLVGTPVWKRWLAQCLTATSAPYADLDLQGGILIPPGGYVALGTTIASPASGFLGSMAWVERPIAG